MNSIFSLNQKTNEYKPKLSVKNLSAHPQFGNFWFQEYKHFKIRVAEVHFCGTPFASPRCVRSIKIFF